MPSGSLVTTLATLRRLLLGILLFTSSFSERLAVSAK
jgi:hypothetical protein